MQPLCMVFLVDSRSPSPTKRSPPSASAAEVILLSDSKEENEAANVQNIQTTEGSDEQLDAWVENRVRINEELQHLA